MTGQVANNRVFVDTNIVIYAYDPADVTKHQKARELLQTLSDEGRLVFSVQVLNEFSSVMMRSKRSNSLTPLEVLDIIRDLSAIGEVLPITLEVTLLALQAMTRHNLSFWDSLIWAVAKDNSISLIYSEDFQNGQNVDSVVFHNPF